nr:hypothetical protein [Paenibacillus larvae]
MTAIAALVGNKKLMIDQASKGVTIDQPLYEKKWEWMSRDDRYQLVRKRNSRVRSDQTETQGNGGNKEDV